jgi:hypothetical protein
MQDETNTTTVALETERDCLKVGNALYDAVKRYEKRGMPDKAERASQTREAVISAREAFGHMRVSTSPERALEMHTDILQGALREAEAGRQNNAQAIKQIADEAICPITE